MWCIVQRECRELFRRPRSLWLLGLGLLLFALVFTMIWMSIRESPGLRRPDMGRQIFIPCAMLQLVLLLGLGRIGSYSIAGEQEKDTWDLLIASPVRLWGIVLGKFIASLLFMALVYFAMLPMLSLCFLLGGLSPREMFGTCLILAGGALLAASVGLLLSSLQRSSISAARGAMLILIFYAIGLPYLRVMILKVLLNLRRMPTPAEVLLSPVYALLSLLGELRNVAAPAWFVSRPEWTFFCSAAVISSILLVYVVHRIGAFESHPPFVVRKNNRKSHSLVLQEWEGIPDIANPIWIKEIRAQNARWLFKPKVVYSTLFVLGILIGATMITIGGSPNIRESLGISSVFTLIGIVFFALTGPAGAIARERDRKTWDVLRTSACSSRDIIEGKTYAELRYVIICAASFFLGLYGTLRMALELSGRPNYQSGHGMQLFSAALLITSCIVFYVGARIYFSSRAKDSARAHTQTFAVVLLHCLGPLMLGFFAEIIRNARQYGNFWRDLLMSFSPLKLIFVDIMEVNSHGFPGSQWKTWVFVNCIVLVTIGIFLIRAAWRQIDRCEE
ncbi:MAG TPA: ABC transporter permease subunit [bacterium]|nr:ABC transporter permease subunit [bacterium]